MSERIRELIKNMLKNANLIGIFNEQHPMRNN